MDKAQIVCVIFAGLNFFGAGGQDTKCAGVVSLALAALALWGAL